MRLNRSFPLGDGRVDVTVDLPEEIFISFEGGGHPFDHREHEVARALSEATGLPIDWCETNGMDVDSYDLEDVTVDDPEALVATIQMCLTEQLALQAGGEF